MKEQFAEKLMIWWEVKGGGGGVREVQFGEEERGGRAIYFIHVTRALHRSWLPSSSLLLLLLLLIITKLVKCWTINITAQTEKKWNKNNEKKYISHNSPYMHHFRRKMPFVDFVHLLQHHRNYVLLLLLLHLYVCFTNHFCVLLSFCFQSAAHFLILENCRSRAHLIRSRQCGC